MSRADLTALLPFMVIAGGAVLVMLGIAFRRSHRFTFLLTSAIFALSFASLWQASPVAPRQVTALLVMDGYAC